MQDVIEQTIALFESNGVDISEDIKELLNSITKDVSSLEEAENLLLRNLDEANDAQH